GQEECGGHCVDVCPSGRPRNTTTCACDCPSGLTLASNGSCCDSGFSVVCGEQICCQLAGEECIGGTCCPAGKGCPGPGVNDVDGRSCCTADQQCCCTQVDEAVHQQTGTGGCVAFACTEIGVPCGGRIGSACHPETVYGCCCGLACLGYSAGNPGRMGTCQIA
ncbi:MAG: hypothetical protein ACRDJH_05310, partial [Thermomicrobiales bacterium]